MVTMMNTITTTMLVNEREVDKMDWNFIGMVVSLFLLGVAYGAIIDCYVAMVRYRRSNFK